MREAPTKFWKPKNLITKERYPTNQNLRNNQLNPLHKKSILEDSYINLDILSSRSLFRHLYFVSSISSTLSIAVTPVNSQSRASVITPVLYRKFKEITQQLSKSNHHQTVSRNTYLYI